MASHAGVRSGDRDRVFFGDAQHGYITLQSTSYRWAGMTDHAGEEGGCLNDLLLTLPVAGLAWWLGLYVIAREPRSPRLNRSGAGLLIYAMAASVDLLSRMTEGSGTLDQLRWPLVLLPALFWIGALIALLPETLPARWALDAGWRLAVGPVAVGLVVVGLATGIGLGRQPTLAGLLVSGLLLLPMLTLAISIWFWCRTRNRFDALGLPLLFTIFFGLSTGLIALPADWLPRPAVLVLIGIDLVGIGLSVARFDAFALGEALLPDMIRSFDAAFLGGLVFGGQVGLAMLLATGVTPAMTVLLLGTVLTAVTATTLAGPLTDYLDRVAFQRFPRLRLARQELRTATSGLPRSEGTGDPAGLDQVTFDKLVRQALRHVADLPRLATSPLVHHPALAERFPEGVGPLDRAVALRSLLVESIERLKPDDRVAFATSDAWRHYNALYYPYVAGVKPYRRQPSPTLNDPAARAALEWLRADVPERTLHNWQNAASQLVARDLRARLGVQPASLPLTPAAPTRPRLTPEQRSASD